MSKVCSGSLHEYLESRSQNVCIHKSLAKSIGNISCVPKGAILGPLFFILYINDIPLFLSNTEEVIYADDLTLTTMCNNVKKSRIKSTY